MALSVGHRQLVCASLASSWIAQVQLQLVGSEKIEFTLNCEKFRSFVQYVLSDRLLFPELPLFSFSEQFALLVKCSFCMEDVSESIFYEMPSCGCIMCDDCLVNSIEFMVQSAFFSARSDENGNRLFFTGGNIIIPTTIACPCRSSKSTKIKLFPRAIREKLEPFLDAAADSRRSVSGAISDIHLLDQKLCPACGYPCSKELNLNGPVFPGLSAGTARCNHIRCPSCNLDLCFVCMNDYNRGCSCPSNDIEVTLVSSEDTGSWALARISGLWYTSAIVSICSMVEPQSGPSTAAAASVVHVFNKHGGLVSADDALYPADPLCPSRSEQISVFVSNGIVKRVRTYRGDAPFRQLLSAKVVTVVHPLLGEYQTQNAIGCGEDERSNTGVTMVDWVKLYTDASGICKRLETSQHPPITIAASLNSTSSWGQAHHKEPDLLDHWRLTHLAIFEPMQREWGQIAFSSRSQLPMFRVDCSITRRMIRAYLYRYLRQNGPLRQNGALPISTLSGTTAKLSTATVPHIMELK